VINVDGEHVDTLHAMGYHKTKEEEYKQTTKEQAPVDGPSVWDRTRRNYEGGAVIVWVALIVAAALILRGTPYFAQLLPILGGGAVWFVVIEPTVLAREREPKTPFIYTARS
jgi:hypothetical protein